VTRAPCLGAEGTRRYWEAERPAREAERATVRDAAAAEIGPVSEREILIAGAVAYWVTCTAGSRDGPLALLRL
jgi:hypothetical protein